MRDEKRYTEKEMVRLNSQAFEYGAAFNEALHNGSGACNIRIDHSVHHGEAGRRYPLPKVERPRVVTDKQGVDWRVIGDVAQARFDADHPWESRPIISMTKDRALLIADLFARPSELVDDEG
jgi:hypothetical protein